MAVYPQPTPEPIPGFNTQIDTLKRQEGTYRSNLNNSATAFGAAPSSSRDISNQQELLKIQKSIQGLQDKKLKAQWYPPKTSEDIDISGEGSVAPLGAVGATLDFIGRPVRGVVGAVKHFAGQGTGTLLDDMANNIEREKEYFGDVISRSGAPGWVSAPLGLTLDITFDPINWATMGQAAIIPRIVGGVIKGGIKGGAVATKSGVLEKAVTAGRFVPYLKGSEAFSSLKGKAFSATNEYETVTGQTLENIMQRRSGAGIGNARMPLSTIVKQVAGAIPGGERALETLWYDPIGWVKEAVDRDIIKRAFSSEGIVDVAGAANARRLDPNADISSFMKPAQKTIESTPTGAEISETPTNIFSQKEVDTVLAALPQGPIRDRLSAAAQEMVGKIDDVPTIMKDPKVGLTGDALEMGLRNLNETGFMGGGLTLEDVAQVMKSGALGDTGVKWFDNFMQGINDFRKKVYDNGKQIGGIGQSTLAYYDKFMVLFRGAKVGGSPVGHLNSIVGNAMMNHLGIGDIGPEYWVLYKQVYDMYQGVPGSAAKLQGMLMDAGIYDQVARDLKYMETATKGTYGTMPSFIDAKEDAAMLLMNFKTEAARQAGLDMTGMTAEELAPLLPKMMEDLAKKQASLPRKPDLSGTATVRAMKGKVDVNRFDIGTDIVSQEMFEKQAGREMLEYIAQMAKDNPGHPGWRAANFVYNKMSNQYAKWDQISKMTTFLRSTMQGYTKAQMMRARNLIDIAAEDFTAVTHDSAGKALGITRYRLSPRKGTELANALYMNYAAMPSAVRVLRNLPLVGSPFASFMYGMALKTGQTLAYNPAAFNKVTFAMNEFGGTKSPLEKQAMDTSFYSYLKSPGMFRIPFTDANPLYANLANMIPYYSMNLFTPSHANYDTSTLSGSFAQYVNASPFLKEPIGSTLFTNLILPSILSEGIQPQGAFGQAIWPSDAGFLTKLAYTARDFSELVVPGVAAFAGIPGGFAVPQATPFVPLYGYRNIANAVQGKNVYGISGKEPAASRSIRGILSRLGVPVQSPINLTYTPKDK